MKLTKEYLVKGSIFALEQCGLLLSDAVVLLDQKSYSSSVVLAAFAREELGRSRILENFFNELVKNKKECSLDEVKKSCEDHITKQEWGQLSTTMRFQNGSQLDKLIRERNKLLQTNQTQTEEFKKLEKAVEELTEIKRRRTPGDRHKARAIALYVEPNQDGTDWNMPKKVTPEFAREFVQEAVNDYSARIQILASSLRINPEFSKELSNWTDIPEIPHPKWPNFQTNK